MLLEAIIVEAPYFILNDDIVIVLNSSCFHRGTNLLILTTILAPFATH